MRKYEKPIIEEEVIEIEDIVAVSVGDLGSLPGDTEHQYPWGK